jgi:hypothetical protein
MQTTDTLSQVRAAWQAPAFSRETIEADPWTAVYRPIPETLPASFGVFTLQDARALVREMMVATVEPNDWEPVEGRLTFENYKVDVAKPACYSGKCVTGRQLL